MRRLMAVPLSVAMLMFVVRTSAAQSVSTSKTGQLNVGSGGSAAPQPTATPAAKPAGASLSVGGTATGKAASGSTASGGATTQVGAPRTGTAAATTPPAATTSAAAGAAAATTPPAAATPAAAGAATMAASTSTTPATAVAATTTTTNTAVKDEPVDAGTYGVRLRDLEQRINELKEQIFRSKARLSLLAETVLQGVVSGSQARIVHENKMGNSYKLVKIVYALDGAPIFNKADEEGGLGDQEEFDIYNGSIVPGEHTLTVKLEYLGHGYGIFSYLKGYRFKVSSSHTFTAPEAKALTLHIVGYEKGGPTAPLEERPAVRYVERVAATVQSSAQAGAGGG
jgi:hypothetical protein